MTDDIEKDCAARLQEARAFKSEIQADLMEGYFFTAPRRARDVTSTAASVRNGWSKPQDQAELQTTLGIECAEDFTGMVVDAFMPENLDWVKRGQGQVGDDDWRNIKDEAGKQDATIMKSIRASNFMAVLEQSFNPDLALGTAAIWIEDKGLLHMPQCRAIPIKNLEINVGPDGMVSDRFVVLWLKARDIKKTFSEDMLNQLPQAQKDKINKRPNSELECVWALWPTGTYDTGEKWQYTITVDKKKIHSEELMGEGSCPLIVMRFNADINSPFGDGCILQALPYLRMIDALAAVTQDNAEFQVDPSFIYPNDGIINFEGGLQHGMAYPAQTGFTRNDIAWLRPDSNPNAGFFTIEEIRTAIKRLCYSDFPEQKGKTPPTAAQWIDEVVKMQKRLGLKGKMFWAEGPRAVFMRFKFILEAKGTIKRLTKAGANGVEIPLALEPYNPAVKGQEFQEVQTAERLLSMILQLGGLQGQAVVNVPETFEAIKKKLGDDLVVFNDPEAVKQMLAALTPQSDINIGNSLKG